MAAMPNMFTAAACGQGKPNGGGSLEIPQRRSVLERLRLRAPPLSPKWSTEWPAFVAWYAVFVGKRDGAACGARLLKRLGEVMNRTGTHLRRDDGTCPLAGKGDPDAFEQFLDTELAFKPKDASIPMVWTCCCVSNVAVLSGLGLVRARAVVGGLGRVRASLFLPRGFA